MTGTPTKEWWYCKLFLRAQSSEFDLFPFLKHLFPKNTESIYVNKDFKNNLTSITLNLKVVYYKKNYKLTLYHILVVVNGIDKSYHIIFFI